MVVHCSFFSTHYSPITIHSQLLQRGREVVHEGVDQFQVRERAWELRSLFGSRLCAATGVSRGKAQQLTAMWKNRSIASVQDLRERAAWQRTLIPALALQFFLALAMTASPWLHERLHQDAGDEHHECVVTVMHSGGTDGTIVTPTLAQDFQPAPQFVAVAEDSSSSVVSIFLRAHVFEHAPPSLA